MKAKHALAGLFLFIASIILSLVLFEAILRVAYHPPAVIAGWKSFSEENEQNQLGFRGRNIEYSDTDFVILLLGDSQVEGYGVGFDSMPEKFLENQMASHGKPCRVFTIGAGGYGQDQQLLALMEYFRKFRADVVVLWQTPKNDVWNNMFPTHWPADGMRKPTYTIAGDSLAGPDCMPGQMLYASRLRLISLVKHAAGFISRDRMADRALPRAYEPLCSYAGSSSIEWQARWDSNKGDMRSENLASEKSHLAMWLTPASPRMQWGLKLTRLLVQKIESTAISNKSRFILFRAEPQSQTADPADTVYVLNGKYYRTSKSQMENNMSYINQGFECVVVPVYSSDWRVKPEDAHLNAKSIDLAMKELALRIVKAPGK